MKPVVFTDLDGTLLHPVSYSFKEAEPAIRMLKEKKIPIVMTSSKTRKEIELYRERLSIKDPFISENGGGIFIPEGYFPFHVEGTSIDGYRVIMFGRPYEEVRRVLREIGSTLGVDIRGFGDMTVKEVAELTGLSEQEAALSMKRDFVEPFVCTRDDRLLKEVLEEIEKRGFRWTRGRFYHIMGEHDKGRAVRVLADYYRRLYGRVITIGLGDSLNDEPMLRAVDIAVCVAKKDGSYEPFGIEGIIKADGIGPSGWNTAIINIIKRLQEQGSYGS